MKVLILFVTTLVSAAVAFGTNWLALIPWRRARTSHWTERARLYHPVRTAAASNVWVIPAVMVLIALHIGSRELPHGLLIMLFAAVGTVIGTVSVTREVFPWSGSRDVLRYTIVFALIRFSSVFAFIVVGTLMPPEFNWKVAAIFFGMATFVYLWNIRLWLTVSTWLGVLTPAPERLKKIVEEAAAGMRVTVKQVLLLRFPMAQAFAMPRTKSLIFTERLLEIAPDNEVAAICAHELGHLSESRWQYRARYILMLQFLPWVLVRPITHSAGQLGFFALLLFTVAIPIVYRRFSFKLETRADAIAKTNEADPGIYARALARLYEDSLVPAVTAKEHLTHPHLYDRLIAAGVNPDYPRPKPAAALAWHGIVFAALMGFLAAFLVVRSFASKVSDAMPQLPEIHMKEATQDAKRYDNHVPSEE